MIMGIGEDESLEDGIAVTNVATGFAADQQGEITILIIAPILITFIVFINLIIPLLYSNEFSPIVNMLRWAAIGVFFKAGSWLVSFLFLSKGDGKLFFFNELFTHIYTLALNILLYHFYGLTGLGISYLIAYFLYLIQVIIVTKKNYSFEFDLDFIKILIIQVSLASLTFLCVKNIENYYFFGVILVILSSWFSIFSKISVESSYARVGSSTNPLFINSSCSLLFILGF